MSDQILLMPVRHLEMWLIANSFHDSGIEACLRLGMQHLIFNNRQDVLDKSRAQSSQV